MINSAGQLTSIIILNRNTQGLLRQCIESIRQCTARGSYELIVVDNGSDDGSVPWILSQPDIRHIFNERNEGFPKGCNQGLAIARGTELLLLNSDVIVTPHWLDNMKEILYFKDEVGAVSCVTNYCSNGQQIDVPSNLRGNVTAIMDFGRQFNEQRPRQVSVRGTLVGFCYLFRKEIYQKLGGLDERFTPGNYEDDDYSLRILAAGYQLLCCEDTFIYHIGSASFINNPASLAKYKAILHRNERLFLTKWQLTADYKSLSVEELKSHVQKVIRGHMPGGKKQAGAFAVVVIPIYKDVLDPFEQLSLEQAVKVLGDYPIAFVAPDGLVPNYGEVARGINIEYFPKEFFTSVANYSQLCLQDGFYDRFSEYDYMLIHQLDAFVFSDRLAEFCHLGVDYIGAPVPRFFRSWHCLLHSQVGNGGLSLRKIAAVRAVLARKEELLQNHPLRQWFLANEDMYFAYCGEQTSFIVADLETALRFAIQDDVRHVFRRLDTCLPFGVHAWASKINIFRKFIERAGYKIPCGKTTIKGDARKLAVLDYLQGRNKVNLHYIYTAIKWQRPRQALDLLLKWLEEYPQGHPAWLNTSDRILFLWSNSRVLRQAGSPHQAFTSELLEKSLGRAFIRSYYTNGFDAAHVSLFAFTKELLKSLPEDLDLRQELALLIERTMEVCQQAGDDAIYRQCRNQYQYIFSET